MNRFKGHISLPALAVALVLLVAPASAQILVIENGTVHPMTGDPFQGQVVIQNGLITAVGPDASAPSSATRIDAAGMHVYPGLFDAMSTLGLTEVGSVPATNDMAEMGMYNPHLIAATAIHPSSELIPVARANGITHSLVTPRVGRNGVIAGQASLVNLDGWTVEEMAVEASAALVIIWPAIVTRSFDYSTYSWKNTPFKDAKEKAKEKQDELRDWMDAARQYQQAKGAKDSRAVMDQKLSALARCLDGGMPVVIQANAKRDIDAAVAFSEEYGLTLILSGGRDAWKVRETLAEKDIPVILGRTFSTPREQDDSYDLPYASPGMLRGAGVRIAFSSGAGVRWGSGGAHSSRTTPYEAAMAAAFGLSEDDAMKALTLWPAEILGVSDRLGSLEPGKVANVIVTDGSPLVMSSNVQHLIIAGHVVPTDNFHRDLYEKYGARPLPKPDAALEASR